MKPDLSCDPLVKRGPSLHILVPTLKCNMECVYCHAGMGGQSADMSDETGIQAISFACTAPSERVIFEFQGGEPLLCFDFIRRMHSHATEASGKRLSFQVTTNLTLMDDEKASWLISNRIGLCTSLDGPQALHDHNRTIRNASSFDHCSKWIRQLPSISALPTITRASLAYPQAIVDTYIELGLQTIHLRYLNSLGAAKRNWEEIGYSAAAFNSFWKQSLDHILRKNREGKRIRERMAMIILKKMVKGIEPNYTELRNPCGAVTGQLVYTSDGGIYSCDEGRMTGDHRFLVGTLGDVSTYGELSRSPRARSLIHSCFIKDPRCHSCEYVRYCGICPIADLSAGGFSDFRCQINRFQFSYIEHLLSQATEREIMISWLEER